MLQNARFGTGLNKYTQYISIFDNSKTSDQYFRLFDVPDKLYSGRNSFRIRANLDNLVQGSLIYIDIIDSTGKIIYHEVADFIGEDKARLLIAHVYENTPPGEATVYIAGRAKRNATTGQAIPYTTKPGGWDHIDIPNVMWTGKVIVIPNQQNDDEILFGRPPRVTSIERFEFFNNYSGSIDRQVIDTGSFSFSMKSVVGAYEFSNTSKYATRFKEDGQNTILDPKTESGKVVTNQKLLPLYSDLATLVDGNENFNRDMVGGEIVFRNMNALLGISTDVIDIQDFSCSVIEVIDSKTAKVSPGFNIIYGAAGSRQQCNTFIGASNVTASYYSSTPSLQTIDSESFVQLDFSELEPLAGSVESVKISYKPYGSFGEFINIGDFLINEQNYLVDESDLITTKVDLVERPIGHFSSSASFTDYWEMIAGSKNITNGLSSPLDTGQHIEVVSDNDPDIEYIAYVKLKDQYAIPAIENTEFKLSLSLQFETRADASLPLQIDVHMSGSGVQRDIVHEWDGQAPLKSFDLGQFVGSINENAIGQTRKYNFYFKAINSCDIVPYFVLRNTDQFSFKDITISPRNELGFSPNQAKLFLPIDTLRTNTELVMNIDYLSGTGIKSKVSSQLYGLTFTGQGIKLPDGVLSGSVDWDDISDKPDDLVSGSRQLADDISGSWSNWSSSISSSLNDVSGSLSDLDSKTLHSGSSQVDYGSVSNVPGGIISGSEQVDFGGISNVPDGLISGSTWLNFSGSVEDRITELELSGSGFLTGVDWNDVGDKPDGIFSGSEQLPPGVVSGSDQTIDHLPDGTVSGSGQVDYPNISNIPYIYQGFIALLSGSAISTLGGSNVPWELQGEAQGKDAALENGGVTFRIPSSVPSSSVFMVRMCCTVDVADSFHLDINYGTPSGFSSSLMQTFHAADSGSFFNTQTPIIVHPNHTINILVQHPPVHTGGFIVRDGMANIEIQYIA